MSSNGSGHASVEDYLSDFQQQVEAAMPDELPGSSGMSELVGIYISRDNKRRIVIFIQTEPRELTRINYVMPVSRAGAPLFRLEGLQPHTSPVFSTMAIAVGSDATGTATAWAAANNVASWALEISRVHDAEAIEPAPGRRRKMHNLVVYWKAMRAAITRALSGIGIRYTGESSTEPLYSSNAHSSSSGVPRSVSGSANSDPRRRRTSSAARSASATRRRHLRHTRSSSRRTSTSKRRISSNPT